MSHLIEELEFHRIRMGLTKEKMAQMVDVPYGTYLRWIRTKGKLSPLAIKVIMELPFMK